MKKFFKDFKAFICRGNIIDMAIGVIIGGAFSAIVTALTDKIIMPFINWILSLGGGDGMSSAFTYLKKVYDADGVVDLTNSIYIDWGAFITAVINFLIIALTLFIIIKVAMKSSQLLKNASDKMVKGNPTKEEKAELKAQGVNMKNIVEVRNATIALREKKAQEAQALAEANKEPPKPTTEELLTEILAELKKDKNQD